MSNKRPGTVDYSKFDNIDSDSDSESEDSYTPNVNNVNKSQFDDNDSEDDYSEDSVPSIAPVPAVPSPSLAQLQRAWNTDVSGSTKPCANCFAPNAPCRCSRCKLVRYCNAACQARYHPIHKLECIDESKHKSYWGMFDDKKKSAEEEEGADDRAVLLARRSSKRRRALQRAAARNAMERARRARGVEAKGGPTKGKAAEEREETCKICQCEFTVAGDGGVAFSCPASHYMCNECAGVWVNSVLGDLTTSYPPKCPTCKGLISTETFERQLTSTQENTFRAHAARTSLKPGEELIECKECGLFEVVAHDPVLWWCPHCKDASCRVCNKDLPPEGTDQFTFDIWKSEHSKCAKLREPKRLIEEAIEEGSKMRCPSCNLAGRKDDACTHMTCTKCATSWCYVCGLDAKTADKGEGRGDDRDLDDIYLHNKDWERNPKRCPMYLTQILEVDLNWLGEDWENNATDEDFQDDEKCVDYLHRFKTIKLLQEVQAKVGDKQFIEAFVTFESIKNCGYTYKEVISTCTDTLIDRHQFIQDNGGVLGGDGAEAAAHDLEDEDDFFDAEELEEHMVQQAVERSAETLQEDAATREATARSETDTAGGNHELFQFGGAH